MSTIPRISSPFKDSVASEVQGRARSLIADGKIADMGQLRNYIDSHFLGYFKALTEGPYKPKIYRQGNSRDSAIHNSNMSGISRSLDIAFAEAEDLLQLTAAQYAIFNQSSDSLIGRLSSAADELDSIRKEVEEEQFFSTGGSVSVFSDDFSNLNKVDLAYGDGVKASVKSGESRVTLPAEENKSRGGNVKTIKIELATARTTDSTAWQLAAGGDGLPDEPKAYEGKRFDFLGSARPQSNVWRIETKNTLATESVSTLEFDRYYTDLLMTPVLPKNADILTDVPAVSTGTVKVDTYTISGPTTHTGATDPVLKVAGAVLVGVQVVGWTNSDGSKETLVADVNGNIPAYTITGITTKDAPAPVTAAGSYSLLNPDTTRITPDDYLWDADETGDADKTWRGSYINGAVAADPKYRVNAGVLKRKDFVYVETDPTDEQLQTNRFKMVDGDARTFWEIEYTPVDSAVNALLVTNLTGATTGAELSGAFQKYSNIISNYVKNNSYAVGQHLEFDIVIDLDGAYVMNYIALDPLYFNSEDKANFEILDIITTAPDNSTDTLPDFKVEAVGKNTNDKISESKLAQAGLSNAYAFQAKGFWTFPARKVKSIRFKIKQTRALANPYQVKEVQLLRKTSYSISQSKSNSKTSAHAFSNKTDSRSGSGNVLERGQTTKLVRFTYLESVLDHLTSGQNTELLAGTTNSDSVATQLASSNEDSLKEGTGGMFTQVGISTGLAIGKASAPQTVVPTGETLGSFGGMISGAALGGVLGYAIDELFTNSKGGSSSSSVNNNFNDSGYYINKQYTATMWNRVRFAVGIRNIDLMSKRFKESGTVASIEYNIPSNGKLSLEVHEHIPSEYMTYGPATPWIEYYAVINGKATRLAPRKGAISSLPHKNYPKTIDLSDVKDTIVKVRFMAVLKRPSENQLKDAESSTPAIMRYSFIVEGK